MVENPQSASQIEEEIESTLSLRSKGESRRKASWQVFPNEVIVIRPQVFYENKDCQADNKFMRQSGLKAEDTNQIVSST
jgi:hypothetical protein